MHLELDSPLGHWTGIFTDQFWHACVHEDDPLSAEIKEAVKLSSTKRTEMPVELFLERWKSYWKRGGVSFSDIPMRLVGLSPFQRNVLTATQKIPAGECASYRDLAQEVGSANAARAVGSTLAKNPLLLGVPCHRVLPRMAEERVEKWFVALRPQLGAPCTEPSERFEFLETIIRANLDTISPSPEQAVQLLVGEFRLGSFMKLLLFTHERWV